MKKTMLIAIVLAVELCASSFVQAQGTLYLSNLGQTSIGTSSIGSDKWIAQEFYTGGNSNGYMLDSIQLLMNAASGNPNGFAVSIYDQSSSRPYGPLNDAGNLSGPDPSAGGVLTYNASGITLLPSTVYFVVLTADTQVSTGSYSWSIPNNGNYISSDGWQLQDFTYSSSDGSNWSSHRGSLYQLGIYATPVPEPSAGMLFGLGGLLLLGLGRWKTKVVA